METVFNPQEVGKGIADFGFLIIAGASYLIYSATLFFFFIKWFVRIVNGIIEKQQRVLDEVLTVHRNKQEAKGEAKHDSCYMQSAVVKSAQDQSKVQAGKHPVTTANRVKSVLTVLMIALLALWIYYVFRRRKLF